MDTIQMHLEIENALNETLKQTQVSMKNFNSLVEASASKFSNLTKETTAVSDNYDDIETSSKNISGFTNLWSNTLGKVRNALASVLPGFTTIFSAAAIGETIKSALDFDTALTKVSFRMGDAGKSARQMRTAYHGITQETGISNENAVELVTNLRRMRIPVKDIQDLGIAVTKFSEVTGMSAQSAQTLGAELIRTGGLSVKMSKEIMTSMAQVQRAVGMTEGDMEILGTSIVENTKWLNQMDKTAGFIGDFNKGVIKLAGAFSQVGVDISEVAQLMDRVLDPGRIEDNAFLYAKLGISMQDALTGDLDPGMMAERFKGLGEELKGMSGPAAAAMAQSLGMPLKQLRQMAEVDLSKLGEGEKGLGDMWKEAITPQEQLEKATNRIKDYMVQGAEYLLDAIKKIKPIMLAIGVGLLIAFAVIWPKLRKKFFGLATDFKETLTSATSDAITMGQKKAAEISKRQTRRTGGREGLQQRVEAGPGFEQMQELAKTFDILAGSDLFPAIKKMTTNTAEWLRQISMGSKSTSLMGQLTEENNQAIKDRIGMYQIEKSIMSERLKDDIERRDKNQKEIATRMDFLNTLDESGDLTARQQKELLMLTKEDNKLTKEIEKSTKQKGDYEKRFYDYSENQIRKLQPLALKQLYDESEQRKQLLESQQTVARIRLDELTVQKQALNLQEQSLQKAIQEVSERIKGGDATAETMSDMIKFNKQLEETKGLQTDITYEANSLEMNFAESNKELTQTNDKLEKINKVALSTGKNMNNIDIPLREGAITKTMNFIGSTFRKAGSNLTDAFKKARESAAAMGQNIVEKLKPSNWLKSIRASIRGFTDKEGNETRGVMKNLGGSLGKVGGFLAKLAIPMMLLGLASEAMQPIMEALKPVMDILKDVVGDLVKLLAEKILPPILRIAAKLLPILGMLIDKLLPPILMILGKLVELIGNYLIGMIGKLILSMTELGFKIKAMFMSQGESRDKLSGELLETFKSQNDGLTTEEALRKIGAMNKEDLKQSYAEAAAANSTLGKVANEIIGFGETISGVGKTIYETGKEMSGSTRFFDAATKMAGVFEDVANKAERGELFTPAGAGAGAATSSAGGIAASLRARGGGITVESEAQMITQNAAEQTAENTAETKDAAVITAEETIKQNEKIDILTNEVRNLTSAVKAGSGGSIITPRGNSIQLER